MIDLEEFYKNEIERLKQENDLLRKNIETYKGRQKYLVKQRTMLTRENALLLEGKFDFIKDTVFIVYSDGTNGNCYFVKEKANDKENKVTNFARIKRMSVDELSDFICDIYSSNEHEEIRVDGDWILPEDVEEWLEKECDFSGC